MIADRLPAAMGVGGILGSLAGLMQGHKARFAHANKQRALIKYDWTRIEYVSDLAMDGPIIAAYMGAGAVIGAASVVTLPVLAVHCMMTTWYVPESVRLS